MFESKADIENIAKTLVEELIEASGSHSKNGKCDYSDVMLAKLERIKQSIPVWGIESLPIEAADLDRRSNMLGGVPYTSEKHRWPLNDELNPYYPLIQLDLSNISVLCSKNFGSGLLQVWLDVSDSELPSIIRTIDLDEMHGDPLQDAPSIESIQKVDASGIWFCISSKLIFKFMGHMLAHWGDSDVEWDSERDLSDKEEAILNRLGELSEAHGYRSLSVNWLMGYPDRGSGSPAGRYVPEPMNLIQFAKSDAFPLVDASCYANIFYSDEDGDATYSFDWNG